MSRPDPPLRADGRCAHCRGERKTAGLAPVYRREAERDPFCSAPCARAWQCQNSNPALTRPSRGA